MQTSATHGGEDVGKTREGKKERSARVFSHCEDNEEVGHLKKKEKKSKNKKGGGKYTMKRTLEGGRTSEQKSGNENSQARVGDDKKFQGYREKTTARHAGRINEKVAIKTASRSKGEIKPLPTDIMTRRRVEWRGVYGKREKNGKTTGKKRPEIYEKVILPI